MKRILLPAVIVLAGVALVLGMVATRPKPQKAEARFEGTLVSTVTVAAATGKVRLPVQGTVTASETLQLQAEVPGRVVWRSPDLVPGGRFRKGDVLLRIDPREYALALEQQKAAVDRARLELELERSRQAVAEHEWEILSRTRGVGAGAPPADKDTALALRGPQVRTARVAVEAAESGLERARLALEKTTLRAPFNALVQTARVDVGQVVQPQQVLATLVGTDVYWVQVSVPVDWLAWLLAPDGSLRPTGAVVRADLGSGSVERQGRVTRLLGDVDPAGRMARVLVEIEDPLGLARRSAGRPGRPAAAGARADAGAPVERLPLLIGTFVNVEIGAAELADVVALPERALREGGQVYLVGPDGKLEIRRVTVAYRSADTVYVREGLAPGDRVVTSRLAAPVAGMPLRVADDGRAAAPRVTP